MKAVLDAYLNTSLVLRIGIALILGLVVGLVGKSKLLTRARNCFIVYSSECTAT